jgi:hypothetical protein
MWFEIENSPHLASAVFTMLGALLETDRTLATPIVRSDDLWTDHERCVGVKTRVL